MAFLLVAYARSPERGARRAVEALRTAILADDFLTARGLMTKDAADRWWLAGIEAAPANRPVVLHKRNFDKLLTAYREMIASIHPVGARRDGEDVVVEVRMEIPYSVFRVPLTFPTRWRRNGDSWTLQNLDIGSGDFQTLVWRAIDEQSIRGEGAGFPPEILRQEVKPPAPPPPAVAPRFSCPEGMVAVPAGESWFRVSGHRYVLAAAFDRRVDVGDYCIDPYEASRPSATATDAGNAKDEPAGSRAGVLPWVEVTWDEANDACRRAGKRLCTGAEWQKAGGGREGWFYPYGNTFDPELCNTYAPDRVTRPVAPTGSFSRCVTPLGVYDMSGNVSEWTDEFWQDGVPDRVLRGGAFSVNTDNVQMLFPFFGWRFLSYNEAVSSIHHHTPDTSVADDGFRCCADPLK